ncbi:MAG: ATP-binding cassette domain-containing protein [Oscillospiraceae bacterium]|jgi:putative ABC transport system ATP-binding protein|nr:ATP-binding cassette domain-containing protein [Oscillospiraceae bacterium]
MLRIEDVCKTFLPGTVHERRALAHLSLRVAAGDFVTIIGGNGAGKSTLFNLVAGVFYPDTGRVLLGGQDITYWPEHRRAHQIGRLMQDPMAGTAPGMTIEENITLAMLRGTRRVFGLSRRERERARTLLARLDMGLENRLHTRVGLLSGGERQAVSLVMSTVVPPRLLLLDEHTAALDPQAARKVLRITDAVVRGGETPITTLMITHNIATALEMGNRTLMLDEGEIVLDLDAPARQGLTVEALLALFAERRKKKFDVDRVLLS